MKIKNISILVILLVISCGSGGQSSTTGPIFTNPVTKIAETSNPDFTTQLFEEAQALEPLLIQSGVKVHMGYWSGTGNRDALVTLLNSINNYISPVTEPANRAIWDEGVTTSTSDQYPAYITMNREYWYERKDAVNHRVTIDGLTYYDPYTVTLQQANDIWGEYSQRYADMADAIWQATGNSVSCWCFVEGAYANRVFYTYELPELETLENTGAVNVFFARTQDADWTDPNDWIEGTANAPQPQPATDLSSQNISADSMNPDDF